MKSFPTLYKLDSKGKTREWTIAANYRNVGQYDVRYGLLGGKQQQTFVTVTPKNVGKANETTLEEQAELEAQSLWNKQRDKGYRNLVGPTHQLSMEIAKERLPMLAKSFKDQSHKILFPCFYQPKLDGIRCISELSGVNLIELFSRKGKQFNMIPHLYNPIRDVLELPQAKGWKLDGELYSQSLDFQTITSIVRKAKTEDPRAAEVQYHIYDCFHPTIKMVYEERKEFLAELLKNVDLPIHRVETGEIGSGEEVASLLIKFEKLGYEGIMLRNKKGLYENDRRSENLQKVKTFLDEEFEIVSGKSGVGKFTGMCIFTCKCGNGTFDVMPMGTEEKRKQYLKDLPSLIGQPLTVRFFEYTNDGMPRFPVGVEIRSYE